jgi:hypothetical protein
MTFFAAYALHACMTQLALVLYSSPPPVIAQHHSVHYVAVNYIKLQCLCTESVSTTTMLSITAHTIAGQQRAVCTQVVHFCLYCKVLSVLEVVVSVDIHYL